MQAAINEIYGPPGILEIRTIKKPVPRDHEVLIRVYATTVNRTDCAILRAKPFIMRFGMGLLKPKTPIGGTDFAGKIEAVGKDVTSFKVGDRVFGFNDMGVSSHAQYMTLGEGQALATMPENSTYEAAAASLEGVHYAYNMINKIPLKSGEKVLVNGATGAIGSAAVQLSKYFGAEVTAVGNTKNLELLKSLGADQVIDYLTTDFTKSGGKYHYVFDAVGKSSFGQCKPLLEPRGIYISSELGWMLQNLFLPLVTPVFGGKKVIFPIPSNCKRSVLLIKKMMEEGRYKAVIDRKYPLTQIAEAYTYVETGEKTGNVVVDFGD